MLFTIRDILTLKDGRRRVWGYFGSLSTVVGDEKLTSREDLIGLLFFYVQSDEDTFLKVDEVSKTEAQPFDVFNQLVGSFQFCV